MTYEDRTECSETSTHKIQIPGNHPKDRIQHSWHGKSFKSGRLFIHSWFQTFAVFRMLYFLFWANPRRLNFMCWRFRTLCSIFIGGVSRKNKQDKIARVFIQVRFGSKIAWAN